MAAEIVHEVESAVRSYCSSRVRYLKDPALTVDDVVQETLVAVAASSTLRELGTDQAVAYAIGIARYKITDAFRASGRLRSLPAGDDEPDHPDTGPGPVELVERAELAEHLRTLLVRLPGQQAAVLQMRILDGYTAAETADVLGSTSGSVRVTQHRALNRLREMLGEVSPH